MADRSIRPAEPGDAAAVRDLVRAAYASYVERIGKEPAPMLEEDYAALIRAGEVWVLDRGRGGARGAGDQAGRGPYVLGQRGRRARAPGEGPRAPSS